MMEQLPALFLDLPQHIKIIAGALLFLTALFVLVYLIPGLYFRVRIALLLYRLRRLNRNNGGDPTELFEKDRRLAHLWQEYKHTLHEQRALESRTGRQEVIALRATVPAEMFFNSEALVDSRLRTEFFKHLPGIFTGVGIIGTFLGLIQGLKAFRATEDPQVVRESLEKLLHGVWEAFLVSAVAIALAMVITFIEKWLASGLYRKVEELAQLVDSMFQSGAGEEYLARLVKASESSASQTKILKDALVADLKQVLTELTERQIQAISQSSKTIGQDVSTTFERGLREPLDRVAKAMEQVSQDQGQATTRLITDVLAGFSQRMQELFGSQIAGINQLQQQTIQALQGAVARLEQMTANIDSAGQRATDAMSTRLTAALDQMEGRQRLMNERMGEFVEQIRNLVRESQSETGQALQAALTALSENVSNLVESLKREVEEASTSHTARERRMTEFTSETVGVLSGQVESVIGQVAQASTQMRASVEAMRSATGDALSKLNSGAETLYLAATDFAKAGQGVTGALTHSTTLTERLTQAAGAVASSTQALQNVVADYSANRQALERMLGNLQGTVEGAKREAALTSDILSRIEGATTRLVQAQKEADGYLEKVSEVLAEAHQEFADQMRQTVGKANTEFHQNLTSATKLLGDAIQELDTTLASAGTRRRT